MNNDDLKFGISIMAAAIGVAIIAAVLVLSIDAHADQYTYERGNIIGIIDTDPPTATLTIADKLSSVHTTLTCDMIGVGADSAVVVCGDQTFLLTPGAEHGYLAPDVIQVKRRENETCRTYYNPFVGWGLTCTPDDFWTNPFIRGDKK